MQKYRGETVEFRFAGPYVSAFMVEGGKVLNPGVAFTLSDIIGFLVSIGYTVLIPDAKEE